MLLELEPQNPVNYVLASNFYAATGRWEDTAKTRAAMGGAAVRKEAGRSWVTLGDGVHTFIAGDRSILLPSPSTPPKVGTPTTPKQARI